MSAAAISSSSAGAAAEARVAALERSATQEIVFFINGNRVVERGVQPETSLLTYLRKTGLTGAKLGCGEGGCGACTVMVSHWEEKERRVVNRSINACLMPLAAVDGHHVVTVEGIGNVRDGLHPVQQRMAQMAGSQCGFCTPGIVMAMYAFLRNHPSPTMEEFEEAMDGNLCRCTGYRPILDVTKTLASDARPAHCPMGAECCRVKNKGAVAESDEVKRREVAQLPPASSLHPAGHAQSQDHGHGHGHGRAQGQGHGHGHAHRAHGAAETPSAAEDAKHKALGAPRTIVSCSSDKVQQWAAYRATSELIFPAELTRHAFSPLFLRGDLCSWYRPASLADLLALKRRFPDARIVVGNTEVGIEMTLGKRQYRTLITSTHVPELRTLAVRADGHGLLIGASVTLTELREWLDTLLKLERVAPHQRYTLTALLAQLRWFSSTHIRNACCVGGNLCTASPIADLSPVLQAAGAVLTLASMSEGADPSAPPQMREVSLRDFFLEYRKTALRPHEVLVHVSVPFTRPLEFLHAFKQARRREDDISIVTCGLRVQLRAAPDAPSHLRVVDATLSYGGMAAVTKCAERTQQFLAGKEWSEAAIAEAYTTLAEDLPLPPQVIGGQPEFRSALAASFLFKFYVFVCQELERTRAVHKPLVPPSYHSAAEPFHRGVSKGQQVYQVPSDSVNVGQPLPHHSAQQQVTGEAKYADDLPDPKGCLHAAYVLSTRPNASITGISLERAQAVPGFVRFFGAADVPGSNAVGEVVQDEELFASKYVVCVGQIIGMVVAESEAAALRAADLVEVRYGESDRPTILSIDQAIEKGTFLGEQHTLAKGDVAAGFAQAEVIVEGEMRIGGQEHFYLETNACLCLPSENDEMLIIASTQNPAKTQEWASHVLALPASRITCQVKRLGGGFGGKETRSMLISSSVAVAAHVLRRPVRVNVRRDADIVITGQRHPFKAQYRAGAKRDGRFVALDVRLWSNGGYSLDLSQAVLDRALFHIDNVYEWHNLRATGRVCFSNLPSNTAFRGFGGPQGMLITETVVEHLCRALGAKPEAVRELNMVSEGSVTHFGQELIECNIRRVWQQLLETSDYHKRVAAAHDFNARNKFRKRGVALTPTKFGISFTATFMNQGGALVHVYTDGSVMLTHGGTEMGQGLHIKMIQICAHELGVPLECITLAPTATDKVPNTSPTAASMSSDINGMAVVDACRQINERLRPLRERHPQFGWKQLVKQAYFERICLWAQGFHKVPDIHMDWKTGKGKPFRYFTFGAACSDVEIDVLTGDMHILRTDIVMDLGSSLNPAIDIGQIEGAFVQGMGWCTMEELIRGDEEHTWVRPGQTATRGPGAYKIPSFNDVPLDLRVSLLKDAPNPRAVHSSKAVGEPPLFLSASVFFAIKEAVYAYREENGALGHFPLFSPASSERIRMAATDRVVALVTQGRQTGKGGYRPMGSW